jgi:subtilisin family serine protease
MNRHRGGVWPVVFVVLSFLLTACATAKVDEADKKVGEWSYVNTRLASTWWYDRVDVKGARMKGATGAGKKIAVVDTGLLPGHEDFDPAKILPGLAPCASDSANTTDRSGHGTELAGIAAGKDPGNATLGLAPAAGLIPIKVDCGVVYADRLTQGIQGAIDRNADIILIALGGYPTDRPDLDTLLAGLVSKSAGTLFVVASMWDGSTQYPFPQWTTLKNAVVVAAMTLDNTGNEVPFNAKLGDLWAPGRDVQTASIEPTPNAKPHDPYSMQGTSAASAIVAGCAALVKEKTGLTAELLKKALIEAAEAQPNLGSANNKRLNCSKAIP